MARKAYESSREKSYHLKSPAKFECQIHFDLNGFGQESFSCLKRVIALAIVEYFFNKQIDRGLQQLLISHIYQKAKTSISNTIVSDSNRSVLRGFIDFKSIILGHHIPSDLLSDTEIKFHHHVPLFSGSFKLLQISYRASFRLQGYINSEIPRLIELGYVPLDAQKPSRSCIHTCERIFSALNQVVFWQFDEVLKAIDLDLSAVSHAKNYDLAIVPSAPELEQINKPAGNGSFKNKLRSITWKKN